MKKALIVLSGGQDSTTCLFWAIKQGYSCSAITFDYNQLHNIEIESAKKICKIANYDFNKIHFNKSKYVGAKSKKLSIKKILKIDPNYKKNLTNINKGISDMVKWHIKNKNF